MNASAPTEVVERFEQAAAAAGVSVGAALEDALTQWIDRNQ
ncbi:ribbon-helix-helix protein, CopG family [Mycolicibacterium setense]|nr:ribbon-helix-helix protein, CopG family [Mycolicibacterium setense]